MLTIGSLFSGIGGLERGLEKAGLGPVVWQCEIDLYARAVLARHWPHVTRYKDIRRMHAQCADLVCGGFPCQDISSANIRARKGLEGERSGLWDEFLRIIDEGSPRWVVVENSPEWKRWVPAVRLDLWRLGYSSVSFQVSASQVGAPHKRPRVFVVANYNSKGESLGTFNAEMARLCAIAKTLWDWGTAPPRGFRVADGVSDYVHRNRCLGNAVVPQVAEVIGRAIIGTIG
jgi:DNA (cytosine-5)-methyltransferase 1